MGFCALAVRQLGAARRRVTMIEGGHFSLSLLTTGPGLLLRSLLPFVLVRSLPPSLIMRYRMTICFIRRRRRHRRLRNYRHPSN